MSRRQNANKMKASRRGDPKGILFRRHKVVNKFLNFVKWDFYYFNVTYSKYVYGTASIYQGGNAEALFEFRKLFREIPPHLGDEVKFPSLPSPPALYRYFHSPRGGRKKQWFFVQDVVKTEIEVHQQRICCCLYTL